MSITQAMQEAYAAVRPSRVFAFAVEISHPLIQTPIRIVDGVNEAVSLPLTTGGGTVQFQPCAFALRQPSAATKEGPGQGELQIDGISDHVRANIQPLLADGNPIQVLGLEYEIPMVSGAPNYAGVSGPLRRYEGLRIRNIQMTALSVVATLDFRDWNEVNFPRVTYSRELYPALQSV